MWLCVSVAECTTVVEARISRPIVFLMLKGWLLVRRTRYEWMLIVAWTWQDCWKGHRFKYQSHRIGWEESQWNVLLMRCRVCWTDLSCLYTTLHSSDTPGGATAWERTRKPHDGPKTRDPSPYFIKLVNMFFSATGTPVTPTRDALIALDWRQINGSSISDNGADLLT